MDILLILQVFTRREISDRKTIVSHALNAFQGYEKCELLFPLQVFAANSDRDTIVSHVLTPRFRARYVRFVVLTWHRHISMRVELYGCATSWRKTYEINECNVNESASRWINKGRVTSNINPNRKTNCSRLNLTLTSDSGYNHYPKPSLNF